MNIETIPKRNFFVLIECHGLAEYQFNRVLAENESQLYKWAKLQVLPHQKIKKITIKEVK